MQNREYNGENHPKESLEHVLDKLFQQMIDADFVNEETINSLKQIHRKIVEKVGYSSNYYHAPSPIEYAFRTLYDKAVSKMINDGYCPLCGCSLLNKMDLQYRGEYGDYSAYENVNFKTCSCCEFDEQNFDSYL